MGKTVHLKLYYRCLRRINISFNRIFQLADSWKINLISIDQQSRREFTWRFSWWVLWCRVCFFNEIVRVYKQGNKALINWVGRSVQEYIALSLFLPSVDQYRKGHRQYIPALASHSINKSIWAKDSCRTQLRGERGGWLRLKPSNQSFFNRFSFKKLSQKRKVGGDR